MPFNACPAAVAVDLDPRALPFFLSFHLICCRLLLSLLLLLLLFSACCSFLHSTAAAAGGATQETATAAVSEDTYVRTYRDTLPYDVAADRPTD